MEKSFVKGDIVKYSVVDIVGEVKLIHRNNKTKKIEHLEVLVKETENIDIAKGSKYFIHHSFFHRVELLVNDQTELNYSERGELKEFLSFLQENANATAYNYCVDQSLINRDKRLFFKLIGGVEQ